MNKVSKTFRLDKETMRKVEEMAKEENRTINNMVETSLKRFVDKHNKKEDEQRANVANDPS